MVQFFDFQVKSNRNRVLFHIKYLRNWTGKYLKYFCKSLEHCRKSSEVFGYVCFIFESPSGQCHAYNGDLVKKSWQRYKRCGSHWQLLLKTLYAFLLSKCMLYRRGHLTRPLHTWPTHNNMHCFQAFIIIENNPSFYGHLSSKIFQKQGYANFEKGVV